MVALKQGRAQYWRGGAKPYIELISQQSVTLTVFSCEQSFGGRASDLLLALELLVTQMTTYK